MGLEFEDLWLEVMVYEFGNVGGVTVSGVDDGSPGVSFFVDLGAEVEFSCFRVNGFQAIGHLF